MKTIIFKIKCDEENKSLLKELQHDWNVTFRKVYNNLELIKNPHFLKELRVKSSKAKEYLIKEAIAFHERYMSNKERLNEKIYNLELKGEEITKKEFKKLARLKKSYKSKVVFGGKMNLIKRTKDMLTKEEWREKRLYPMVFYGERSSYGNRFFDLKDIINGNIIFKYESTGHKIPFTISTKKHKKDLNLLQHLIREKEIPVTIKLTHDSIHISYDESIVHNSKLDTKKLSKECPFPKEDKEKRKKWWEQKYKEHEEYLKEGKLERYLSVDLNPNQIGFVVIDIDIDTNIDIDIDKNLIYYGCYEIEGDGISSDKRKYEYSQIVKKLFKIVKHYKVSYFVIEELDKLVQEDHGNKVSNRKIKSEWKLNYIKELVERRCNETKTIKVEVPAYYSSFIGNLTYNLYDPIASSMELARRGINKYKSGFKMIPMMEPDNILTDKIDKNIDLTSFKTFIELFKSIRNKSYRRKDKTFFSYLLSPNSHVCLYK